VTQIVSGWPNLASKVCFLFLFSPLVKTLVKLRLSCQVKTLTYYPNMDGSKEFGDLSIQVLYNTKLSKSSNSLSNCTDYFFLLISYKVHFPNTIIIYDTSIYRYGSI